MIRRDGSILRDPESTSVFFCFFFLLMCVNLHPLEIMQIDNCSDKLI